MKSISSGRYKFLDFRLDISLRLRNFKEKIISQKYYSVVNISLIHLKDENHPLGDYRSNCDHENEYLNFLPLIIIVLIEKSKKQYVQYEDRISIWTVELKDLNIMRRRKRKVVFYLFVSFGLSDR